MPGHRPWREIVERMPRNPEREKRREEARKAYAAVRAVVDLADGVGRERGVTPDELARALDASDPDEAAALLDRLAGAVGTLGGRLEIRLVFSDVPEDEVVGPRVVAPEG